jgi:hypothetical protein
MGTEDKLRLTRGDRFKLCTEAPAHRGRSYGGCAADVTGKITEAQLQGYYSTIVGKCQALTQGACTCRQDPPRVCTQMAIHYSSLLGVKQLPQTVVNYDQEITQYRE